MRRFSFYILTALLTFGIGSLIAKRFYLRNEDKSETVEKLNNQPQKNTTSFYNFSTEQFVQTSERRTLEKRFCIDKRILPVWKELTKDDYFREQGSYGESGNCSDMLEVKNIDLNQDGQKEILLRGKNFNLCSAVGNCAFWIYEKKGKRFRKILYSTDYIDITKMPNQIKKNRTNGYFNIVLKGHLNAAETNYLYYKFDGQKYKQNNCLVYTYIPGTNSNPKWKFISCREYDKRQNY